MTTLRLHRSLALVGAASSLSAPLLLPAAAMAQTTGGPNLEASREIAFSAATTFNNSDGVSFEASGSLDGTANFTTSGAAGYSNSGTAFLSGMVSFDSGSSAVLAGVSGQSTTVAATGNQFVTRNSSYLSLAGTTAYASSLSLSGMTITGGGSSSTVGGSVIGTNSGTEVLQFNGSMDETVANTLSAF